MEHHPLSGAEERRFLLVFRPGDEVVGELARFARAQEISAAEFTGIGWLADVRLDGRGPISADADALAIRSLDGTVALVGDGARIDVDVVVGTAGGEPCSGRMTSGRAGSALKLVFIEVLDGVRVLPADRGSVVGNRFRGYLTDLGGRSDLEVET
jgi:predicted DNA-binding protein with PD1-like motif